MSKDLNNADDHRQELDNLAILNHLKHPNIVELLASYTYQGKHSLLFPKAEHGDLANLFNVERQDTSFRSDSIFLAALARLSSAIEHVHSFFEQKLDLKLIGCHHDLRPRNILISGTSLILADFGLSRFKDSSEDSETPFRLGIGDYLAPECENHDESFEPHLIRRSSDVWSFGCILLEAAIYMAMDISAIKQFKAERKSWVSIVKTHLFHNGPGKASEVVQKWLLNLEQSSDTSFIMLLAIIRKMLAIEPSERPTAAEVATRLRCVTLTNLTGPICELFNKVKLDSGLLDVFIEHIRFMSWNYAVGITDIQADIHGPWRLDYFQNCSFESVLDLLGQVRCHLEWRSQQSLGVGLSSLKLSSLIDRLHSHLGLEEQERARNFFKISLNSIGDNISVPEDVGGNPILSLDREIRLSASLKHMTNLMDSHCGIETERDALIDSRKVHVRCKFGEHNFAQLLDGNQYHEVLVEWRKYGQLSADESVNRELYVRLNALAKILSAEKPRSMRALYCKGFYHEPSRRAFGMLYALPSAFDKTMQTVQSITLQQWISETTAKPKLWPVLDEKFRLAHMLAKSILDFHIIGWLHKNLNASNVAFFGPADRSTDERVNDVYIIGFDHSRQNNPSALTLEVVDVKNRGYQHPTYRRNSRGYKPEYDYYSLGILLMEIGFWTPLKEIAGIRDTYGDEHDRKLQERVPRLKQHMGRAYCKAVTACLSDDFGSSCASNDPEHDKKIFTSFESRVLHHLSGCFAKS